MVHSGFLMSRPPSADPWKNETREEVNHTVKCEICNENDATVHLKQVCDGEVREMHVCNECAEENGFDLDSPMSLTDFLFGVSEQQKTDFGGGDRMCPGCRMKASDFRKTSLLGCSECYETFKQELALLLKAMHRGSKHVGKAPERERVTVEIASLQAELKKAVEGENFEEAAKLRDALRAMKAGQREELKTA